MNTDNALTTHFAPAPRGGCVARFITPGKGIQLIRARLHVDSMKRANTSNAAPVIAIADSYSKGLMFE